jgi:hypothetical protein
MQDSKLEQPVILVQGRTNKIKARKLFLNTNETKHTQNWLKNCLVKNVEPLAF